MKAHLTSMTKLDFAKNYVTSLAWQCVVAVLGSMLLGSIPEVIFAWTHSLYFYPGMAFAGLVLGFFVSKWVRGGQGAQFVWVIGSLWMALMIYGLASGWSPTWSREPRWAYVEGDLLGPTDRCASSECLDT